MRFGKGIPKLYFAIAYINLLHSLSLGAKYDMLFESIDSSTTKLMYFQTINSHS